MSVITKIRDSNLYPSEIPDFIPSNLSSRY